MKKKIKLFDPSIGQEEQEKISVVLRADFGHQVLALEMC